MNRVIAIGVTGRGKQELLRQKLADYMAEHPLGTVTPAAPGMFWVTPGPDVVPGEIVRTELEGPPDGNNG